MLIKAISPKARPSGAMRGFGEEEGAMPGGGAEAKSTEKERKTVWSKQTAQLR